MTTTPINGLDGRVVIPIIITMVGQGSKLVDFYCSNYLEKHLVMMTEKIDVVSVVTNGVLGFW